MKLRAVYKGGPGSGHRGHLGRPGKVGGSLPGEGGKYQGVIGRNLKRRDDLRKEYARTYANKDREHGHLLNLDSGWEMEFEGTQDRLIMNISRWDHMQYSNDGFFIHNHPKPYGFSIEDVATGIKYNWREISVVYKVGDKAIIETINPMIEKEKGLGYFTTWGFDYRAIVQNTNKYLPDLKAMTDNIMEESGDRNLANRLGYQELWKKVSEEWGWTYTVEEIDLAED